MRNERSRITAVPDDDEQGRGAAGTREDADNEEEFESVRHLHGGLQGG